MAAFFYSEYFSGLCSKMQSAYGRLILKNLKYIFENYYKYVLFFFDGLGMNLYLVLFQIDFVFRFLHFKKNIYINIYHINRSVSLCNQLLQYQLLLYQYNIS